MQGKCASCETPIDVDLLRVKRPQPIGRLGSESFQQQYFDVFECTSVHDDPPPLLSAARLQEPWPPGESLGAKVTLLRAFKTGCATFAVPSASYNYSNANLDL